MHPTTIKTLSAILIVLVLSTLSCQFSFDLGGQKESTASPEVMQVTSAPAEQVAQPTATTVVVPTAVPPTAVPPTKAPTTVPSTAAPKPAASTGSIAAAPRVEAPEPWFHLPTFLPLLLQPWLPRKLANQLPNPSLITPRSSIMYRITGTTKSSRGTKKRRISPLLMVN